MPEPPPGTPEEPRLDSTRHLLERVRAGDEGARERLFARFLPMLTRWAHRRLPGGARDLHETDDLVQVTLMRALANLSTFESRGEGAFLAYLRQILLNQIRDEARRARRRPEHVDLDDSLAGDALDSPLEQAIGRDRVQCYEASLQRLAQSQRQAVILRLELGMRYREIAEALEIPTANAARALVGRGLVHLAQHMREHDESAT